MSGAIRKFLITGAGGQLAKTFLTVLPERGYGSAGAGHAQLDICDTGDFARWLDREEPDAVINCAAYNLVDVAETDPAPAVAVNAQAVAGMAAECRKRDVVFVHYSSDYVFDGRKGSAYTEADKPHPLNKYGQSKLDGEKAVLAEGGSYLIFRVSWVFGPGTSNFLHKAEGWAQNRDSLNIVDDEVSVPSYTYDIVDVTLKALEAGKTGLYHLCNSGQCSRYEWLQYYFGKTGRPVQLNPVPASSMNIPTPRPPHSVMSNAKIARELGITIPEWQDAVDRFIKAGLKD